MSKNETKKVRLSLAEALNFDQYTDADSVLRAKNLCEVYLIVQKQDEDRLWQTYKMLAFLYETGRRDGIREERARRKKA